MQLEETLDPENWEQTRALGHKILDDMFDYLKNIREQPVWQSMPSEIKSRYQSPIPKKGEDLDTIYEEFKRNILPYPMGCSHPRFWGWVRSNGLPTTILAEIITATLNSNTGGGEHAALYLENQVINWIKKIFDYPIEASGLLVSGCSMANFIGLAIARNSKAEYDIFKKGIKSDEKKLMFYGSVEMHSSIDKAIQLLGLGHDSLRKIPVDKNFEIRTDLLRETIEGDINKGFQPICIIANVGSINTGSIDDLDTLADLAKEYDIWLHIDGAFGVWSKISSSLAHKTKGLERADSIAFDLHKWMYLQYEAGCILVKNKEDHHKSFAVVPEYLEHKEKGLAGGEFWPGEYGIQLSRKDRALKIWMAIKVHGIEKFGRMIEQNIQQAKYLTELIKQEENLELLTPTSMNVVNFRYYDGRTSSEILNKLNEEIVIQLQEKGSFVASNTKIGKNCSIRVAIVNHRTKREDFDLFIERVVRTAKEQFANGK